jgi:PAS domain S-box-containing protein
VIAVAGLLFAAVFLLRVTGEEPGQAVALLYALPITLLAVELGMASGIGGAALALGLFGVWDAAWNPAAPDALSYVTRGTAFFALGAAAGTLADRMRSVSSENASVWELSSDMLCTAGFHGYFERLNPAWERTLGWTAEELRSQPFVEFVHPRDRAQTEEEASRLMSVNHATRSFENRYRCKDGSYRTIRWSARSIPERGLIYATARDVTESRLARLAAEAAQAEAQRANQAKSEFLSRMSHELRTPLNAVIGFGQLLQLDVTDARQREAVEQIVKAGNHLRELINEVLDISQIESGTMSMSLEPVHLPGVLADALSLIRPMSDQAHVRVIADASECAHVHVLADQQRLKQVIINLLSNAVKYNRCGGEVHVRCTALADERIEVAVADTGRGMTAQQLQRLFEPFDRLGAESSEVEGTGLGLSLSKSLMEAMGGAIGAESEPGNGSTMRIELNSAKQPQAAAARNRPPPAAGAAPHESHTIMYIEDNLSSLKLVEQLLARFPEIRLIAAMQGQLGIDLVRHHHPDLILLDHHLPDLHGLHVLEQLKGDPQTAAIPIVVLSADASPTQLQGLRAAGAAGFLTKPIDVQALLDTVRANTAAPATP